MAEITRVGPGGKSGVVAQIIPSQNANAEKVAAEAPQAGREEGATGEADESALEIDDLLKLLDQQLIEGLEFDEAFLESLPEGLYSYRGRRGGARMLVAVQLMILLQQQHMANQPAINFQQAAALRQLHAVHTQLREIMRLPPMQQTQKLQEIMQAPGLRQVMVDIKQALQAAGSLPQGASFQKLVQVAALNIVRSADPAVQKLAIDLRARIDKGQLSPRATQAAVQLLQLAQKIGGQQRAAISGVQRAIVPDSRAAFVAAPRNMAVPTANLRADARPFTPGVVEVKAPQPAAPLSRISAERAQMASSPSNPLQATQKAETATAPQTVQVAVEGLREIRAVTQAQSQSPLMPPSLRQIAGSAVKAIDSAVSPPAALTRIEMPREIQKEALPQAKAAMRARVQASVQREATPMLQPKMAVATPTAQAPAVAAMPAAPDKSAAAEDRRPTNDAKPEAAPKEEQQKAEAEKPQSPKQQEAALPAAAVQSAAPAQNLPSAEDRKQVASVGNRAARRARVNTRGSESAAKAAQEIGQSDSEVAICCQTNESNNISTAQIAQARAENSR